jgi:hypothetical protein
MKIAEYSRFRHNDLNAFLPDKATDLLVVLGWNPGRGRAPSLIPDKEFVDHMNVLVVGGPLVRSDRRTPH